MAAPARPKNHWDRVPDWNDEDYPDTPDAFWLARAQRAREVAVGIEEQVIKYIIKYCTLFLWFWL